MTLAKSVVTGIVFRVPEKRFTSNNVAVSAFVLNIGEKDEILVRVISVKNYLDGVVSSLSKGDKVLVEGRLQIALVKNDDGSEKRVYEIDANSIEKMGATSTNISENSTNNEEIVKFAQEDFSDELIGEDEIPF
jgi:single-stranded DNA-binding protein